jgi:hypothetical protein
MSKLQNPLIILIGIFVSFFLLAQLEKYNLWTTAYGQIMKTCGLPNDTGVWEVYENCLSRRSQEIRVKYGKSVRELQDEKELKNIFLIIPGVILITTLFVIFAVSKNEILLTMITLTPFLWNFWNYRPEPLRVELAPYYAIFTFLVAELVWRLKKYLF